MNWMRFLGPTFTLQIPTQWAILATPQFQVLFLSPPTQQGKQANLTIAVQPMQTNSTLEIVTDRLLQEEAEAYPNFELQEKQAIRTVSDISGIHAIITWNKPVDNTPVHQQQFFFTDGELLYILTASRANNWDEALAAQIDQVFYEMAQSMQFEAAMLEQIFQQS